MSMRIYRHLLAEVDAVAGTDRVLGGMDIPSECQLNNVWGECHVVGPAIAASNACMYGVKGVTVFRDDVDTAQSFNSLWDTQVPKDQELSAAGFDLSGVTDATPEFEPGEPDVTKIFDIQLFDDDMEWYKRRKLISFATSKGGFLDATPDSYVPTDFFKIRSRRNQRMEVTGASMLGFSSPSLDDTTTNEFNTIGSESEVVSMKYIEVILEQAWMSLVGLTESGAETPWLEAQNAIAQFLEPDVFEETAGSFAPVTWVVYCMSTWDLTVPGRREFKNLSLA